MADELTETGRCVYCSEAIGGGPGGYWSLVTTLERCVKSKTGFHEATPSTARSEPNHG